jgi:hypothetical protein
MKPMIETSGGPVPCPHEEWYEKRAFRVCMRCGLVQDKPCPHLYEYEEKSSMKRCRYCGEQKDTADERTGMAF